MNKALFAVFLIGIGIAAATNTAGPGAPIATPERGDAKRSAIRASENYWVPDAPAAPSDPHPPAAANGER
jgi:hypothetical protein